MPIANTATFRYFEDSHRSILNYYFYLILIASHLKHVTLRDEQSKQLDVIAAVLTTAFKDYLFMFSCNKGTGIR